jgi:hypothetical protein
MTVMVGRDGNLLEVDLYTWSKGNGHEALKKSVEKSDAWQRPTGAQTPGSSDL